MAHVIDVVDTNIVAEITADDSAVVNTNGHGKIVELVAGFMQIAYSDEPEKITVFNQICVKSFAD